MNNTDDILYAPLSEIEKIKLMNRDEFFAWLKTFGSDSKKLGSYTMAEWDELLDAISNKLPILK